MFFLLYIPVISRPMSPEAIEELAAQLADRMLESNPNAIGQGENMPRNKQELQEYIAELMTSLQEKHGQEAPALQMDGELETGQDGAVPSADELDAAEDVERLLPARDFLERCFKKSA